MKSLLVALGYNQLKEAQTIAQKHGLVIFGTMDQKILTRVEGEKILPVYFYETG